MNEIHPITPRDIKLFINEVGALHRQWCPEVPLTHQAAYCLYRNSLAKDLKALAKGDLLTIQAQDLLPEGDWRVSFATLHFNIQKNKAMEVLLRPVLDRALHNGEGDLLLEYEGMPGLSTIIDHYLEENWRDWANKEPTAIASAASSLGKLGPDESTGKSWQWLRLGVQSVDQWSGFNAEIAAGLCRIFEHAPEENKDALCKKIVAGICTDPKTNTGDGADAVGSIIQAWVDGLIPLFEVFKDRGCFPILEANLRVPGFASSYLDAVKRIDAGGQDGLIPVFRPKLPQTEIIAELARICQEGAFSHDNRVMLEALLKVNESWSWTSLINALKDRLQASNKLSPPELTACLGSLLLLKHRGKTQAADQMLGVICAQGHLMHHLYAVRNDANVSALCVFSYLSTKPDVANVQILGNGQEGINWYRQFLSAPQSLPGCAKRISTISVEFELASLPIIAFTSDSNTQQLASEILQETVSRADIASLIRAEYFLDEYGAFSSLLSAEAIQSLVITLTKSGNLVDVAVSRDFNREFGYIYLGAYQSSDPGDRERLRLLIIPWISKFEKKRMGGASAF